MLLTKAKACLPSCRGSWEKFLLVLIQRLGCLALCFANSVFPAEQSEADAVGEENCLSHSQTGCRGGGFPSGYFLLFSPWLCKSDMSCSFCPSRVSKPLAHHVLAACQSLVEQ